MTDSRSLDRLVLFWSAAGRSLVSMFFARCPSTSTETVLEHCAQSHRRISGALEQPLQENMSALLRLVLHLFLLATPSIAVGKSSLRCANTPNQISIEFHLTCKRARSRLPGS